MINALFTIDCCTKLTTI